MTPKNFLKVISLLILKLLTNINGNTPVYWLNMKWLRTKKGYFCGDSNTQLKLIIHKDNVVITLIIQIYVLYWYHTYLLHPGTDVTAAKIFQYFYWNGIRNSARKEGSDYDTCHRTKFSNTKYSKVIAK